MSKFCSACGQSLPGDGRFCTGCGQAVEPAAQPDVDDALYWSAEFPLVTSRFFLWDIFKFLFFTFLVLQVVMVFMTIAAGDSPADALKFIPIWGIAVGGLGVLVLLVSLVVLGNRSGAVYRMDDQGLAMVNRSKLTPLNELSQWLGVLSGSGQLWASGVLAQAQEKIYIKWKSVHAVRAYPSDRVVELSDSFHMAMRVYCPAEVYPEVVRQAEAQAARALQARQAQGQSTGKGGLAILGWLFLTVLATLLGLCWDPEVNDVGFMVVLTAMFVFISGMLPGVLHRGLGIFGLLSGLCALAHRLYHLADPRVLRMDTEFWPASFASLGCFALVLQACYQIFRKDQAGQETVMFDEDLEEE
ncbi:zinc ribbon domain-containing protein [bacterium]|nr:zinc ribbon domain-containing protein [bacterium]